jgi:hypothetical protein
MTRVCSTPGRSIITDRPVVAGVGAPIAIKRTLPGAFRQIEAVWRGRTTC